MREVPAVGSHIEVRSDRYPEGWQGPRETTWYPAVVQSHFFIGPGHGKPCFDALVTDDPRFEALDCTLRVDSDWWRHPE